MIRLPPGNMAEMVTFLRADGVPLDEALDIARARFPAEATVARYEEELRMGVVGSLPVPQAHLAKLVELARKGLSK